MSAKNGRLSAQRHPPPAVPKPSSTAPTPGKRTDLTSQQTCEVTQQVLSQARVIVNSARDLAAQADYVVWRDGVARPAHRPKKSFSTESVLPAADPGDLVAHRWRKRLTC